MHNSIVFLISVFLCWSPFSHAQDDIYEWENAGSFDGERYEEPNPNIHSHNSRTPSFWDSKLTIAMATAGTAVTFASLACLGSSSCRKYIDRLTESTPFSRIKNIKQASPEQCRGFAAQAKEAAGIRDWGKVPKAKLDQYIGQLKQIAADSGYPTPGTPQ